MSLKKVAVLKPKPRKPLPLSQQGLYAQLHAVRNAG
jgi:hypothetical protein